MLRPPAPRGGCPQSLRAARSRWGLPLLPLGPLGTVRVKLLFYWGLGAAAQAAGGRSGWLGAAPPKEACRPMRQYSCSEALPPPDVKRWYAILVNIIKRLGYKETPQLIRRRHQPAPGNAVCLVGKHVFVPLANRLVMGDCSIKMTPRPTWRPAMKHLSITFLSVLFLVSSRSSKIIIV